MSIIVDPFECGGSSPLAFIAGAGISVDSPSNLPLAGHFIKSVIDVLRIDESIKDYVLTCFFNEQLRFEEIIEAISTCYDDNDLHLLDLYGMCNAPNSTHYQLAHAIFLEHKVFTTNFDTLLEQAGKNLGFAINSIFDYRSLDDSKTSPLHVWKLHGTLFDEEYVDQRKSIVATMEKVGMRGEAYSLDELAKKAVLSESAERDLVVIGYSGSDDYDVMPLIAHIVDANRLLWVHHTSKTRCIAVKPFCEMPKDFYVGQKIFAKLLQSGIWQPRQLYYVCGNTRLILETLLPKIREGDDQVLTHMPFEVPSTYFDAWKWEYALDGWRNSRFIANVYELVGQYHKAVGYLEKTIKTLTELGESTPIHRLHDDFKSLYIKAKEGDKTIKHLQDARDMLVIMKDEELGRSWPGYFIDLSSAQFDQGDHQSAQETLKIANPDKGTSDEAHWLYERARQLSDCGCDDTCLQYLNRALEIHKAHGALRSVALCLNMMSRLYQQSSSYLNTLSDADESIRIGSIISDKKILFDAIMAKARLTAKIGMLGASEELLEVAYNAIDRFQLDDELRRVVEDGRLKLQRKIQHIRSSGLNDDRDIVAIFVQDVGTSYIYSPFNDADGSFPSPELDLEGNMLKDIIYLNGLLMCSITGEMNFVWGIIPHHNRITDMSREALSCLHVVSKIRDCDRLKLAIFDKED